MQKTDNYSFNHQADFEDSLVWMKTFLQEELKDSHKHEDPETVAEEIEKLIDRLSIIGKPGEVDWK